MRLDPNFSGIVWCFSPFSLMLHVGLLYIAFIMFRYAPFIPALSKSFTLKGCFTLSKAFLASNKMIMCFFFQFVYIADYIDRFSYVESFLQLWYKTNLIMVDGFSDVFLYPVCQYFIFTSVFLSKIGL